MTDFRFAAAGLAVILMLASNSFAQKEEPATKADDDGRYSWRENHDPNGIGKFYMGREIAHVMGFAGARWLERTEREEEERLTLLVRSLKLKPGMIVADIGAGSGVISMLMAEQLLPDGKVMAVDIQQEMLDRLTDNCKKRGVTNIVPVKGEAKSPKLKPGSVDLIILVDVYHEFEFPYEMTLEMSKSLKPGGRIAWVEYRKEDRTVPIKLVHKMSEAQVKREASQEGLGLKFVETIGVLPRQHIVIFEKSNE
ncbi:MAG: class I SAM-dependent methyltransferase [Planctomycetota bacterium]|nr:class I SAM-dependent methyltransferase [Planctomycetota bacterium]MDA0918514.1 class I SAM-dependent methyltransferase [Planctomycetota bacterium]MDA1158434.1 class I SAM-dependent methyltransferase [Planctomycetota bacterium]